MKRKFYKYFVILIIFTAILSSKNIYVYAKERYETLEIFTKVLNYVQRYYVEKVDTKKLIMGGIKGMLKELDPHTNYLPRDIYKEFESETSGEFGGIGIEITLQSGVLTVISPIEDTPAWMAGIKSGDKIVKINGESTKGLSLVEAAQRMKGKKNSTVNLGIFRDGFKAPKDFIIKRGVVKLKSVKYTDLDSGYAYLRITSFMETTHKELQKQYNKHKKKNNNQVKGIIIDLRRNPGGLLDQAVKISDMFLDKGIIVSTVGRNKKEKDVTYARAEGTEKDVPVVVLINEYSASASEIVAGALQDNKRALIMGKRSFGKGSVQTVVKLGDGSGLKLTVARYYTPSGRSIQAEGVDPDVVVEPLSSEIIKKSLQSRKVRREKDMKGHLLGDSERRGRKSMSSFDLWWSQQVGKDDRKKKLTKGKKLIQSDFQIMQAYNYLKAWKVMRSL